MKTFSVTDLYNNPGFKILLGDKYRIVRHIIYVFFIMLFWVLFDARNLTNWSSIIKLFLYGSSYVVIIYFNLLVLMPRLLYKNKVWPYLIITYITFVIGYAIQHAIYSADWEEFMTLFVFDWARIRDMMINAITFILFCCVGWSFRMFSNWIRSEKRIHDLTTENLKAELNNLKNQVNPHFLFNAFNNIYVTSKSQPHKVPDMVLDMADLMRYQLQECNRDKVPLENELAYIKNFIGIEKVRKDKADIRFEVKGRTDGLMVEPLLFVSLVENAFKHGLGKLDEGYIFISISTHNQGLLHLTVENNKPVHDGETKSTGFGLANLRKRLELGYAGKHRLEIEETKEKFTAKLELQLNEMHSN